MPNPTPYWTKNPDLKSLKDDLSWNFPEQKQGTINIIGGNSASFATEIKIAEFLAKSFPFLKSVRNFFPDALKSSLPPLENFVFFSSTASGSFKKSSEFSSALKIRSFTTSTPINSQFSLFLGDFSKNSETAVAVSDLLKNSAGSPALLTRDAVDLVLAEADSFIDNENLIIFASLIQLQKLFRALYYPRPLLLSQPLLPVVETLHKFTLSYPCLILTFHEGQILAASSGKAVSVPLEKTAYTPISLWNGELAAKLAVYALFNGNKKLLP